MNGEYCCSFLLFYYFRGLFLKKRLLWEKIKIQELLSGAN